MFYQRVQKFSVHLLKFFVIILFSPKSLAQTPYNACPNYFEYLNQDSRFLGKITIPNISPGATRLEVHLSQQGAVPTPNPSSLSLFDNQETTISKVLNGQPIFYRVDFPFPDVLPKLTLITINGRVICADQAYPPPSTEITLTHNLDMKINTYVTPFSVPPNIQTPTTNNYNNNNGLNTLPNSYFTTLNPQQGQQFTTTSINGISVFPNPNSLSGFFPPQPTQPTQKRQGNPNRVCGRENVALTPFIRGGVQLNRGQFPWLTAIYRKKGTDLGFICGGSLLSTRTIITAAHCFREYNLQANRVLVLLGRYNLAAVNEEGSEHHQVQNLIIHPEYNPNMISDADIALLQLDRAVSFSRYISPICLWNQPDDVSYIAGSSAYVAGWGANEKGEPVSHEPKQAETQIVDDNKCRDSLQKYQTQVSTRTLCATSRTREGPCTGDSGGGLMMNSQGRWMLRGIISAGLTRNGYCEGDQYFYFCDVAKHLDWIRQNMLA